MAEITVEVTGFLVLLHAQIKKNRDFQSANHRAASARYCLTRFFVQAEQSYKFFQFFRKSGVVNSISEKKKKRENFFFTTRQNSLIHSVENNLTIISV